VPRVQAILEIGSGPALGRSRGCPGVLNGGNRMIRDKKICVVMPAYNAAATLERTLNEIPSDIVDDIVLVDDASKDNTIEIAKRLGIFTITHDKNKGYGGNQKTCYQTALQRGADIVIMLHPDYQYTPKLLLPMASLLASGFFDVVLGSRILGIGALAGGMPLYKYISNRALTLFQNVLLRHKLSEYHTGYRGFTRKVLEDLPLDRNSDDFVFDNQMLAQIIYRGFRVGEISCPTRYFAEASSINFRRAVTYGLSVLKTSLDYRLACWGWDRGTVFEGLVRRQPMRAALTHGETYQASPGARVCSRCRIDAKIGIPFR
jgi:glycosyltransferase involved in cell wall biosynthesis